jgi:hypothetical protein
MPTLNQHRSLFRETLKVPNATMDMLVTDLLESIKAPSNNEDEYQYVKDLLQGIARLWQKDEQLGRLNGKECWPCRTPKHSHKLYSIGNFFVNDRQNLSDIFAHSHVFLDMDFSATKNIADLLRNQGCDSFLSEKVSIETECCEPLESDHELTQDFRSRANALVKYASSSSIRQRTFHAYFAIGILSTQSASHLTNFSRF